MKNKNTHDDHRRYQTYLKAKSYYIIVIIF